MPRNRQIRQCWHSLNLPWCWKVIPDDRGIFLLPRHPVSHWVHSYHDFIPARISQAVGLADISLSSKCLYVSCWHPFIWHIVRGWFSFPDATWILGFLVGWLSESSSPLVKLAALLMSDRFLPPIECLVSNDTRFSSCEDIMLDQSHHSVQITFS